MYIICYDISNDSLRAKFARFVRKYGRPLQYSVIELKNSPRLLKVILSEIEDNFKKKFTYSDSVLIFPVNETAYKNTFRYGYPVQEEQKIIDID